MALTLWPSGWTKATREYGADGKVLLETGEQDVIQDRIEPNSAPFVPTSFPHDKKMPYILDRLRGALLLAALACILRPTNLLIWLCIGLFSFANASKQERMILLREVVICG